MFCRKCQQEVPRSPQTAKTERDTISSRLSDAVIALESNDLNLDVLPTTRTDCPKCTNNRAYYRTLEIWDDDGDTIDYQIYRCTQCKYTWREKA